LNKIVDNTKRLLTAEQEQLLSIDSQNNAHLSMDEKYVPSKLNFKLDQVQFQRLEQLLLKCTFTIVEIRGQFRQSLLEIAVDDHNVSPRVLNTILSLKNYLLHQITAPTTQLSLQPTKLFYTLCQRVSPSILTVDKFKSLYFRSKSFLLQQGLQVGSQGTLVSTTMPTPVSVSQSTLLGFISNELPPHLFYHEDYVNGVQFDEQLTLYWFIVGESILKHDPRQPSVVEQLGVLLQALQDSCITFERPLNNARGRDTFYDNRILSRIMYFLGNLPTFGFGMKQHHVDHINNLLSKAEWPSTRYLFHRFVSANDRSIQTGSTESYFGSQSFSYGGIITAIAVTIAAAAAFSYYYYSPSFPNVVDRDARDQPHYQDRRRSNDRASYSPK
jgi:hypothetical protein